MLETLDWIPNTWFNVTILVLGLVAGLIYYPLDKFRTIYHLVHEHGPGIIYKYIGKYYFAWASVQDLIRVGDMVYYR